MECVALLRRSEEYVRSCREISSVSDLAPGSRYGPKPLESSSFTLHVQLESPIKFCAQRFNRLITELFEMTGLVEGEFFLGDLLLEQALRPRGSRFGVISK